jgi:purine-binding chemotaxis protein CheW
MRMNTEREPASLRLCTFYLGHLYLGIEIDRVQEVIRRQTITRVPQSPIEVAGLINLRGKIVTALDLYKRFNLQTNQRHGDLINVVVHSQHGLVSLLVEGIGDVVEAHERDLEPPPGTLQSISHDLIRGVFKLEESLLLVLDTDAITDLTTQPNPVG